MSCVACSTIIAHVCLCTSCRPAREGHCVVRGRKAFDPDSGASAGLSEVAHGRALTGQSHYKRHGTTTLFAALKVSTGKIIVNSLAIMTPFYVVCQRPSFCPQSAGKG
jgi:hypothetical protein